MVFDYSKLRGRIVEICGTQQNFTRQMGISGTAVSAKLNNRVEFTQGEILRAAQILQIPADQIRDYFFAESVKKN